MLTALFVILTGVTGSLWLAGSTVVFVKVLTVICAVLTVLSMVGVFGGQKSSPPPPSSGRRL